MAESLLLGLSTGSACVATCGMVMFPYLMAGSAGVKRIISDVTVFLIARFIAYFILATLIYHIGRNFMSSVAIRNFFSCILYIVFALMLIWYSLKRDPHRECPSGISAAVENKRIIPFLLGLVNSFGFCPALLIMLTKGSAEASLGKNYLAFLSFFIGSSVWFLPLPLAGIIKKKEVVRTIGIFATGLAGIIFIIKGFLLLTGGITNG